MLSSRSTRNLAFALMCSVVLVATAAAPAKASKTTSKNTPSTADPKPSDPIDLKYPTKDVATTVSRSSLRSSHIASETTETDATLVHDQRNLLNASAGLAPATLSATSRAATFNFNFDVLGIGNAIAGSISAAQNRDAFVKNLAYTTFYNAHQRYHVMVFNLNVAHAYSLKGVRFYGSANYHGIIFGVWVFESGWFENRGDGGYINWCFIGRFSRNGGHVTFH